MLSVIVVVSAFAGINNQAGPVSGSRDDGREAQALLAKMKTSRDLLKSGTYRATGRLLKNRRSLGVKQPSSDVQNERQAFSPVRLSYIIPAGEPGLPDQLLAECQVRWKDEAGVWVPISLHFERRVRDLNDFCALRFEWISVNKPIPPKLFTADGLDVPVGTRVVDHRAVPPHVGQVKGLAPPR